MKRLILVGLLTVVVASVYSSVYACDRSEKSSVVTTSTTNVVTASTNGKTIRTLVIGATTGCKAGEPAPAMSFEIDVPGRTNPRFIHIVASEKTGNPSPSAFRTAVTLGRAFITAWEAVVGSLLDVASEKTAALV